MQVIVAIVSEAVRGVYELEGKDTINRAEECRAIVAYWRHKHPEALIKLRLIDVEPMPKEVPA